ncbi:MAG TPA: heparan-alpha-glucosaminide N-acetyltransferase domain-containing protein [Clostridia bacterium]|nr:heparan-alpha-glucosaminide N-acetyltransferase domain-containing protein [Clostridia bacterium]
MEATKKKLSQRIGLLDEIRGLSVILMVFYHGFFLLGDVFDLQFGTFFFNFFMPAQPFVAGVFIAVAGISSRLSRSNAKRGAKLFGVALALTFATVVVLPLMGFDGFGISFGILHFLSLSMLFFALAKPVLDYIPPLWGIALCMVLYLFTANIGGGTLGIPPVFKLTVPATLYETSFLFPFGICNKSFMSVDFFPLFPHIFIFLAGTWFGVFVRSEKLPAWAYKTRVKAFAWVGKKAFVVYLAHVPILYAVAFLVRWLLIKTNFIC